MYYIFIKFLFLLGKQHIFHMDLEILTPPSSNIFKYIDDYNLLLGYIWYEILRRKND